MIVFTSLENIKTPPTAIALGLFDGVHMGHQEVIQYAVAAKKEGLIPAVFTFTTGGTSDARPESKKDSQYILTNDLKEKFLEEIGIETIFQIPFLEFRGLTPEQFVKNIVIDTFNAKKIICGFNFHFGKNASASAEDMIKIAHKYDVEVIKVDGVMWDGDAISSTRIRNSLYEGDISSVNAMLNKPYAIRGKVMYGNRIGRTIQFPTINQYFGKDQLVPRHGVYASFVEVDGKIHPGVTNIGTKPTIGVNDPLSETYILDFDRDLYGEYITLNLLEFIRPEQKFDGIDSLRAQIAKDTVTAQHIYEKYAANKPVWLKAKL
ncbi:MAG: bifunctional riboflavin kinase/FAD synthetase [Oscillospiraceae bacterium]